MERGKLPCAQFLSSMVVANLLPNQIEVTDHHALEAGCFVIHAPGWLTEEADRGHSTTPYG